MKAKVILPVTEAASFKWDGKNACQVIVEASGTKYELFAVEGAPAWNLKEGEEVEVDIKSPAAEGRLAKVKLANTRPPFGGGGGGRPSAIPLTPERAKELALIAASVYISVAKHLKDTDPKPTSEDIRAITNTIMMKDEYATTNR